MRVSDVLTKVRYELAEPTPSEWDDKELVSFLNDGFASAWRLAAELHHPLVEQVDTVLVPAGESSVRLEFPPLKMISVSCDGRKLAYAPPSSMPEPRGGPFSLWTIIGLDVLQLWATPELEEGAEGTPLSLRWVREPDILRLEPTTLTDDEIPMPSSVLELLVNFVVAKAHNRLGGSPKMEMSFWQQYRRDVMRALEIREPTLLSCAGYWISPPTRPGRW